MIYVDEKLYQRDRYPHLKAPDENFKSFKDDSRTLSNYNSKKFFVYLFSPSIHNKYSCAVETGFFNLACHIDKVGLYNRSVLHSAKAQKIINEFEYEEDIFELMQTKSLEDSKYRQPHNDIEWNGVVFASQNPSDRSITQVSNTKVWYDKLRECAKYYGKNLLVKLHPWNKHKERKVENIIRSICKPFGCTVGYFNHTCITNCEFVIVGCSSFSIDCMMRKIPVKQLLPGYFHTCNAITYCEDDIRKDIRNDVDVIQSGLQLTNFLARRYCFRMDISYRGWQDIIYSFEANKKSNSLFPLPLEHSYYNYVKTKRSA